MHERAHNVAARVLSHAAWLVCCLVPAKAHAQTDSFRRAVQWEARVDALAGPPAGVQAGAGANVASGSYLRIGLDAAAGVASAGGRAVPSARVDFVTRYLLDPFGEFRWGPYAGGGFTAQRDRRANTNAWRGDLLLVVGFEGPAHAGWRTSIEMALGGGARLGVVLRRARANGR